MKFTKRTGSTSTTSARNTTTTATTHSDNTGRELSAAVPSSARPSLFFTDSSQPSPRLTKSLKWSTLLIIIHKTITLFVRHYCSPVELRKWHPAVDVPMNDDSSKSSDNTIPTSSTSSLPLYILRPQDFHNNRLLSPPHPHPSSPLLFSLASSDQNFELRKCCL
ncbi:hypothetical protein M378DRAFT_658133 [Amanita muscaria Koide BX008]|uniref:Uncharacterized protein n=1 Tax=Amanita muscaria (strain Koide BX008) TaxID=946122 RepID=A0A0C2X3H7_AMAMK|nr:hypothetical protein M378DRAFT_658133 [Amanita muscaria Koide BX008]